MLAFTRKAKKTNLSAIFKPLPHESILVRDEIIFYCERQHWASLAIPTIEITSSLFIITAIATGSSTSSGVTTFFTAIGIVWLSLRIFKSKTWKKSTASIAIGGLIFTAFVLGPRLLAILLIIFMCLRFTVSFAFWAFYHRRYITNRRVIATEGILGYSISTMPLSRVTDISMSKTIPAEIFDYAVLRVETAGQDQALSSIRYLTRPDEFYEILINLSTSEVDFEKYFEV